MNGGCLVSNFHRRIGGSRRKMIYFIVCGDLVKIGRASNVRARLASLQTGNPMPMMLLGEIHGDKTVEFDLHQLFYSFRVRGEWFRYDGELRAFIEKAIAAPAAVGDVAVPYGLLDADSAFVGLFDSVSGRVYRAYVQARRAVRHSSIGQWWRFGEGWEEGTNPVGHDPVEYYKRMPADVVGKIVFCALQEASEFECRERRGALRRLLQKAKELRP